MTMTLQELREAAQDNYGQPEGPARNARAEHLLAEAEQLGDPLAVIEGLRHQLQVYNYSSEKNKMFVPFARLLRMWDERPEDFDKYEIHTLHWTFKWMAGGMLDQPSVPLAAIEKWQAEMAHRYRLAGHSERAVRMGQFAIARHVGDRERAARAYEAWLAADRDEMADCHACELHSQGSWQRHLGDDAKALELWRPVLDGEHTCAHEPHAALASSLLPLVRLGRLEEARANHLRGFRLVRPMESMRSAFAQHIEFCALTGNEARALEILAERPGYFAGEGNPDSRSNFLEAVTLLMDRLTALGLGGQAVPGPAGQDWTAAALAVHARTEALAIAALFDARNGTPEIGDRTRQRMDQAPLLDRLPLGIRARRLAPAAAPKSAEQPAASASLPELLARARQLSDASHPDAGAAWAAVGASGDQSALDPYDRAQVLDHWAMRGALDAGPRVTAFRDAAELYEAAGDPGEAAAARARAAYALARDGRAEEALAALAEPHARVLALHAEGRATARQVSGVLVALARVHECRMHPEHPERAEALERAVREVLAFAEPRIADDRVASRVADAYGMLGDLAGFRGDLAGARELYERSITTYTEANLAWYAAETEARLAGLCRHLDDAEGAERALRAALEHGGAYVEPAGRAHLHLQLSEVLGATGQLEGAADHALEAGYWADEAGEGAGIGAYARHLLGGWLLRLDRTAEAATVLEAALLDLTEDEHGSGAVVQTLWWLGDCLTALGEPREAAEHWLRAADIARHWPEQRDHAMLANLAAQALYRAELNPEAEQAYRRAGELWRELGNTQALIRTVRVRGWLALREGQAGPEAARAFMAEAAAECERALAGAEADARPHLLAELADTHRQSAELLARMAEAPTEEALTFADRAVATFAEAGPDHLDARTGAELMAAWMELDLGRPEAAEARARGVLAAYADAATPEAAARREEAESVLEHVRG
ncbi:tetratricopeptide repeat protein [Streptomyces violascens]|uniref:Tetratricopeptide repeat protein n=1 Tax=Streptomyces violascens TaxID=67381 RepID=A0ABQ3QZF6_9ACTN|nr:hypothetical protein GCM10010289_64090 [Streptomyces violascens]GHI42657.1 hypothetical protein Sviol_70650 [Streptomyces violascens]